MKKKWKRILIICLLLAVLLVPIREAWKDGGTVTYTSLTYKYIRWNCMRDVDEENYTGTSIYFFPKNFKSLDELFELETGNP